MADAVWDHGAQAHRDRWQTCNLVTNPFQQNVRIYLGGYPAAFSKELIDQLDSTRIVNCTHAGCPAVGQPMDWQLQAPYRWRRQEVSMAPTDNINAVIEWWVSLFIFLQSAIPPTRASSPTAVQARTGQRPLFAPCAW